MSDGFCRVWMRSGDAMDLPYGEYARLVQAMAARYDSHALFHTALAEDGDHAFFRLDDVAAAVRLSSDSLAKHEARRAVERLLGDSDA